MEEKKHCKWYNDEFCTNDQSPCVADYCPVVEYPELCKFREVAEDINVPNKTELSDEEIVKSLECCTEPGRCTQCPYSIKGIDCVNEQRHVKDILAFIHSLQSENKTLKTELRKECEEHEEFTKKAKVEILEWNKLFNEKRAESDLHKIQNAKLEEELSSLKKTVEILTKREFDEQRKTYLCGKCQERVFEKYKEKETQISEQKAEIERLTLAVEGLKGENKVIHKENDELLGKIERLTKENSNVISIYDALYRDKAELQKQVNDLKEELENKKAEEGEIYKWAKNNILGRVE